MRGPTPLPPTTRHPNLGAAPPLVILNAAQRPPHVILNVAKRSEESIGPPRPTLFPSRYPRAYGNPMEKRASVNTPSPCPRACGDPLPFLHLPIIPSPSRNLASGQPLPFLQLHVILTSAQRPPLVILNAAQRPPLVILNAAQRPPLVILNAAQRSEESIVPHAQPPPLFPSRYPRAYEPPSPPPKLPPLRPNFEYDMLSLEQLSERLFLIASTRTKEKLEAGL